MTAPSINASIAPSGSQAQAELAISTSHLRKEYAARGSGAGKKFVAVADLTLDVPRGQIFGFLGPNGAGKTTTINMLLGNVYPTDGRGTLLGAPLGDLTSRRGLGFLPEKFQFHEFLTADEFMDLHGRLYGMSAAERKAASGEALERVGLASRRSSKLGEFSKGMQQRAGLAQAIMNHPDLVILDEPTSALDPLGRRDVRALLMDLKAEGVTVFLNSHLLSEIEMTCDQVAIIKQGRVVRQGTVDSLLAATHTVAMRVRGVSEGLLRDLQSVTPEKIERDGEMLTVVIQNEDAIPELARIVVGGGAALLSLVPQRESLEDLFIRVVEEKGQITP